MKVGQNNSVFWLRIGEGANYQVEPGTTFIRATHGMHIDQNGICRFPARVVPVVAIGST